jgi:hypothetical protein
MRRWGAILHTEEGPDAETRFVEYLHLYFVGLDVHKQVIAYCVKTAAGEIVAEGRCGDSGGAGRMGENPAWPWQKAGSHHA